MDTIKPSASLALAVTVLADLVVAIAGRVAIHTPNDVTYRLAEAVAITALVVMPFYSSRVPFPRIKDADWNAAASIALGVVGAILAMLCWIL